MGGSGRDPPSLRPRQTATQIMRPFSLGLHLMFTRMGGCPRLPDRYQRHRRYASHADSRPLLRVREFNAIAKNVRVGYVFLFDDRNEYLEGDRVVGEPHLRGSIYAAIDCTGASR